MKEGRAYNCTDNAQLSAEKSLGVGVPTTLQAGEAEAIKIDTLA